MSGAREPVARPRAADELRPLALHTLPGRNYWARRPVTRLDLAVGAYEEIASCDVPGFAERLLAALPGLVEHECSVGARGGFVQRLARGTYAPHVLEHVALELQRAAGDDEGYGRARGSGVPGTYHVVVAHAHAAVGRAALAWGLAVVRAAWDGAPLPVEAAHAALRVARAGPDDDPPPTRRVAWGVCGGASLAAAVARLTPRAAPADDGRDDGSGSVAAVPPDMPLARGLPYAASAGALVLADAADAVPAGYRDPERCTRLLTVMADGVVRGGLLVCPAHEAAQRRYAEARGLRVHPYVVPPGGDVVEAAVNAAVQAGARAAAARGDTPGAG